jgi:membrane associated rhomboid family serine protease
MKSVFQRFFTSLPFGARLLVLFYALGFPLAYVGQRTHAFDLYDWLAMFPPLVKKGEVWSLVTYAFLPLGIVDWVVSLFWLSTLVGVIGRNWSSGELWGYCLLAAGFGGVVVVAFNPPMQFGLAGNGAIIFALLAAWYRLYGRERLVLLGVGEMSVRQAAIIVAVVEFLVSFFCLGWLITLAMMSGGVVGWFYLFLRGKHALNRRSQIVDSERIARLEL